MNPQSWQRVRKAFEHATSIPSDQRGNYLDRAVGEDSPERTAVERLLAAEAGSADYLEPPTHDALRSAGLERFAEPKRSLVGGHIGSYRIVGPIGSGGMGTVYEAEQSTPRRTVALKVMRWSLASKTAARRFRYESEILARLQHPCIAQVYEAGVLDEDGVETPWFAMEHLRDARSIVAFADETRLDVDGRIELFTDFCAAVHHGHQRGVIHRDLKPANLLVDASGRAKVIDFGIGLRTDVANRSDTRLTSEHGLLGTLNYMSPEQVSGPSVDLDIRTDVYSLGVVLFELLTGSFPYDVDGRSLSERTRVICEVEPRRASTVAATVPRELEWVVLKAIEKDPERRYESVQRLIDDLRRFRADEPVHAGPPSRTYHIRKFVRRHRVAVVASLLVLATLVAGITGTSVFAIEADQRLEQFDYLANVVRLREARQEALALRPGWPDQIEATERWLEQRATPLLDKLPALEAAIDRIRTRARRTTPEQLRLGREGHPRIQELGLLRRKLEALGTAMAVRKDRAELQAIDVPEQQRSLSSQRLAFLAHARTHDGRPSHAYGREAEGLALARLAVTKADAGRKARAFEVLAWACYANGLDAEAVEAANLALQAPRSPEAHHLAASMRELRERATVGEWADEMVQIRSTAREIDALEHAVDNYHRWSFDTESDQFLHDTLAELVVSIREFDAGVVVSTRDNLRWARQLRESMTLFRDRWQDALEAIARADGVTASELYRAHPITLTPQPGLAPIGMNPVTGLWEFYHLRSAEDPSAIPVHAPNGALPFTPGLGIVFVLVPGGKFAMGATPAEQSMARPDEHPVDEVSLHPFFIARTELTQGQWRRLSSGERPSGFNSEYRYSGRTEPINESHPVELVSWIDSNTLLTRFGLTLPTEAQWEYACRAGTTTPWSTGDKPESLVGHSNLIHVTLKPGDYLGTLPAGSFEPNRFGLHDMHGNVREWCRDYKWDYTVPPRVGDGLRSWSSAERSRVARGGAFRLRARFCRSAIRNSVRPRTRTLSTGLRAARALAVDND